MSTPFFDEEYTSIAVDLPGFGESPLTYFKDLSDLADQLHRQLQSQNIQEAVLIGHSLGGYICLELIRKFPSFCKGLVLFHANAFEDSAERKSVRQVYLDAFERFGGDFFLRNFHENLFYQSNDRIISQLKKKHEHISVETLQRYTASMMNRLGYDELLENELPKMIISGVFDKSISAEEYLKMYNKAENCELLILSNSAHMGMLEESEKASQGILSFLNENVTD